MPAKNATEAMRRLRHRKVDTVREYKASKGCERCGENDPLCLDLHHRDPDSKHLKLSRPHRKGRRSWGDMSWAAIAAELEKCEVLCANCHRKETASERWGRVPTSQVTG